MIFKTITICNLFSYYQKVVFPLNDPSKEKNIVLIAGRNGHGKTSFINSIKLLFSGPNEELRVGIPGSGRRLTSKQYLFGAPDLWEGVFNRKARKKGENRFYVAIEWEEDAGKVEATREWIITGKDSFLPIIKVRADFLRTGLEKEDAQNFLDERLPQDYIPFFYFDSEQIHKMMDISQNNLQKHMERLLNISQVDTARDYVGKIQSKWRKDAMVEEQKARLREKENDLSEIKGAIAERREKEGYLEDEILDLEDEIEDVSRRLDRLREGSRIGDEKKLKEERKKTEDEIEILGLNIADELSDDSPLLFNTDIVEKVSGHIKAILESDTGTQSDLINSFIRTLPANLFDTPPFPDPSLSEYQTNFYKNRLAQLLQAYKPIPDKEKSLFFFEKRRAVQISDQTIPFLNPVQRKTQLSDMLHRISQAKKRLIDIDLRLEDIPGLTRKEKETFEKAKKELAEKSGKKGQKEEAINELRLKISAFENEIKRLESDIRYQKRQVAVSVEAKVKDKLSQKLKEFFKGYKEALKKKRRQEIEEKLNAFSKKLITSHDQIKQIKVHEDFTLYPTDGTGTPIGVNSLSSGMRQLIATSLLWSLKVVSRKTVPLVIDTPLGRIDKEHQENLLKYYYPFVGEQVIILPTDSELDEEKYNLLRPHICQEFQLQNPDGESTRFNQKPMY